MRILAVLACVALTACAQRQETVAPTYSEIQQSCGGSGKPFVETWTCVRVGLAGFGAYADIRETYIATGDYVVTQVQEGRMTDAEAKLAMAEARQRASEIALAREARDADRESARKAAIFAAYMSRQQTPAPPPPVFAAPRAPVNCWRFGDSVTCY